MDDKSNFAFEGVYVLYLVLGLVGGLLGVGTTPPPKLTKTRIFSTLLAGIVCGMFFPNPTASAVLHFSGWAMPSEVRYLLAFVFGLWGMFIVVGLMVIGEKFSTNPFEIIDRLRGKTLTNPDKTEK